MAKKTINRDDLRAKFKSRSSVLNKKDVLLKDLSAKEESEKKKVVKELSNAVVDIPIEDIEANPEQPRKDFDKEALQELADSIKTYGLIQPITVRHIKETGKFQIISGERRYRASKIAEIKEIPAYVRIADDNFMLEMALVENIQREDLNAIEIATTYDRLIEEFQLTQEQLAERVGKKRSTVTNYLNILHLPPVIKNGLKEQIISTGHAKAIKGVDHKVIQEGLFHRTVQEGLSVRELERIVRTIKSIHGGGLLNTIAHKVGDESLSTSDLMTLINALQKIESPLLRNTLYERVFDVEENFTTQNLEDVTRFLDGIEDLELKQELYNQISEGRTSLVELGAFSGKFLAKKAKAAELQKEKASAKALTKLNLEYQTQERFLKEYFEVPVSLKIKETGEGMITIPFKNVEAFNEILDKIKNGEL